MKANTRSLLQVFFINLKVCGLFSRVSDHNATDKKPMYEMPLTFVFGVRGLGFWGWESIFNIGVLGVGVLSLAFCPEII